MNSKKLIITSLILGTVAALGGCASSGIERPMQAKTLLWSFPKERPTWTVDQVERDDTNYYFVGIAQRHSTEKAARDHALVSATTAATNYIAKNSYADFERTTTGSASEASVNNASVRHKFQERQIAENLVRKLHPKDWYIEQWKGDDGKPFYMAFVRAQIPVDEVELAVDRSSAEYAVKQQGRVEQASPGKASAVKSTSNVVVLDKTPVNGVTVISSQVE